ncbi:hypothetical protein CPC08DRAFT_713868 [Agrocybe pediades]|nr:hypothetical protein CPC08DRAFT_713868 [Agrocybe pediades]
MSLNSARKLISFVYLALLLARATSNPVPQVPNITGVLDTIPSLQGLIRSDQEGGHEDSDVTRRSEETMSLFMAYRSLHRKNY